MTVGIGSLQGGPRCCTDRNKTMIDSWALQEGDVRLSFRNMCHALALLSVHRFEYATVAIAVTEDLVASSKWLFIYAAFFPSAFGSPTSRCWWYNICLGSCVCILGGSICHRLYAENVHSRLVDRYVSSFRFDEWDVNEKVFTAEHSFSKFSFGLARFEEWSTC